MVKLLQCLYLDCYKWWSFGDKSRFNEATESNNWQLETYQFDYGKLRTLLQDYLGADNYAIDSTFFNHSTNESICENKIMNL